MSPNLTGIAVQNNSPEINLMGNPTMQKINLRIKTSSASNYTVRLFDIEGRQLAQLFSGAVNGSQYISYAPENLSTGIYFLRVTSGEAEKVMRVCYTE
jgi:hypothetical protein